MDHEEILKQRDLLDTLLASRLNQFDRIKNMSIMDSIYFKKKLPKKNHPKPIYYISQTDGLLSVSNALAKYHNNHQSSLPLMRPISGQSLHRLVA